MAAAHGDGTAQQAQHRVFAHAHCSDDRNDVLQEEQYDGDCQKANQHFAAFFEGGKICAQTDAGIKGKQQRIFHRVIKGESSVFKFGK